MIPYSDLLLVSKIFKDRSIMAYAVYGGMCHSIYIEYPYGIREKIYAEGSHFYMLLEAHIAALKEIERLKVINPVDLSQQGPVDFSEDVKVKNRGGKR